MHWSISKSDVVGEHIVASIWREFTSNSNYTIACNEYSYHNESIVIMTAGMSHIKVTDPSVSKSIAHVLCSVYVQL